MNNRNKALVSICIPVYNEEEAIPHLFSKLRLVLAPLNYKYNFEIIITDNHSLDATWPQVLLEKKTNNDLFLIRAFRFSKNFGFQNSILANFGYANGSAVIQLDADLQDPPELIATFLEHWEAGYHVVFGVRTSRSESRFSTRIRKRGYALVNLLSEHPIPKNAGDFRLLDRKVVQALSNQRLIDPYLRGSIASLGFNQIGIPYHRLLRNNGQSKFPASKVLSLGIVGVINHSLIPLRISTYVGAIVLMLSFSGGIYYVIQSSLNADLPAGFTTTQVLILAGIGLNAFFLGIIGEYISRIYRLVRQEPSVIIEEEV